MHVDDSLIQELLREAARHRTTITVLAEEGLRLVVAQAPKYDEP